MTEKNIVPNLKAKTSDRNAIFTPRQWLERFRQFTKREHKIDITPLLKKRLYGHRVDHEGNGSPRRFYLGKGTGSLLPNNTNRIQNGSGQYKNKRFNSVIHRTLLTETQYIPQLRGFLLGQTIRK